MNYGAPVNVTAPGPPRQVASDIDALPFLISNIFDEGLMNSFGKPGKPAYSYATLMTYAILTHNPRKMSLAQIYTWLAANFPYFKTAGMGWKNSVRHNLSLNKLFIKVPRPSNEPGKGCYWSLDVAALHADPGLVRRLPQSRTSPEQEMLNSSYPATPLLKPEAVHAGRSTTPPSFEGASSFGPAGPSASGAPGGALTGPPLLTATKKASTTKKRRRSDESQPGRPAPQAPKGTGFEGFGVNGAPLPMPQSTAMRSNPTVGLSMHFVGGPQAATASQPIYYLTSYPYRPQILSAQQRRPSASQPMLAIESATTYIYDTGGVTKLVSKDAPQVVDKTNSFLSAAAPVHAS